MPDKLVNITGLTFDTVLLPRLTPKSFPSMAPERIGRLLFVALTRATRWAYMSTDGQWPLLHRLDRLVKAGQLTTRTPGHAPAPLSPEKNASDDLLDAI